MQVLTLTLALVAGIVTSAIAQNASIPVTGTLGNASIVENNTQGVLYVATLPDVSFSNPGDLRGNIKGSVSATSTLNGTGVNFNVSFSNLPTSGGPFLYHIHVAPVPADGNCTATLGHLDPFIRGEDPSCDDKLPQTCQVGDLSGKHGKVTSDPFTASYTDDFASLTQGLGSFFGNRSLVVHFANKTRITCANFTMVASSNTTVTNSTATTSGSAATGTSSSSSGGSSGSSSASSSGGPTGSETPKSGSSQLAVPLLTLFGAAVFGLLI